MIWLARHGETTWNLAGRYQGRMESALSALGVAQGFALAAAFFERLQRGEAVPERVISSPLLRCTATARFTAERLGRRVETDDRLIEIAHGAWEGRFREDLERDDAARLRAWREEPERVVFPGGESLHDVRARWRAFAADIARDERPTLVVTHDAVIRCALLDLTARPLSAFWETTVENAAFALVERADGVLVLRAPCVTDHLAGVRADAAAQAL
jgi:broad specificity phosphatase PhoE